MCQINSVVHFCAKNYTPKQAQNFDSIFIEFATVYSTPPYRSVSFCHLLNMNATEKDPQTPFQ